MPFAFPVRFRRYLRVLAWGALIVAFALHFATSRRQQQALELLRSENQLLGQENRLLRQQLEAERILAAAQARLATPAPKP
jgi:hypothetical protein